MSQYNASTWTTNPENKVGITKRFLSHLSLRVRKEQLNLLLREYKPKPDETVIDIGISPTEDMVDANYFEKHYPYPSQITALAVEDYSEIKKKYPKIKIIRIEPNVRLPFKSNQFDIATAWATLEHVGNFTKQAKFIREIARVGKKIFITTPYRGCIYEPHTGFFFLHWLPLKIFRFLCKFTGKSFWSSNSNLNPLYVKDIVKMLPGNKFRVIIYMTLGIIPSHLIITNSP